MTESFASTAVTPSVRPEQLRPPPASHLVLDSGDVQSFEPVCAVVTAHSWAS